MWILIMTILGYNGTSAGTAEFSSKAKCLAAAERWQASIVRTRGKGGSDGSAQPVAVCAEK